MNKDEEIFMVMCQKMGFTFAEYMELIREKREIWVVTPNLGAYQVK